MRVALESPDQSEVHTLIGELDAYQDSLYPAESRYALDLVSLMQPQVLFAVARVESGEAVGCGAVVLGSAYGELKRMYVSPNARGLESQAAAKGCPVVMLETGPYQPEALALYRKCGYTTRGPFGDYPNDPLSVFMEKRLENSLSAVSAA
jgi:putative acetyltransferase